MPSNIHLNSGSSAQETKQCFIIAEAGVNHNGNPDLARQLVRAAANAGADAVKFQTFSAQKLVHAGTETAAYQRANAGETDQFAMLRKLELPIAEFRSLAELSAELGIEFMSTPFDREACDALAAIGMRRMKIPSGELTNLPFLESATRHGLPVILSTGMSTLDEVAEAVAAITDVHNKIFQGTTPRDILTILHCTSSYPTAPIDVNLRAMQTLQARFGVPVGYSDHTEGATIAVAAVALGATVVEKHFTLDRTLPGPDHKASLEPAAFADMVKQIRLVEQSLGTGIKSPAAVELATRELVRRSAFAARALASGCVLVEADIELLRPGTGIPPREVPRLLGRRTRRAFAPGEMLAWGDIET